MSDDGFKLDKHANAELPEMFFLFFSFLFAFVCRAISSSRVAKCSATLVDIVRRDALPSHESPDFASFYLITISQDYY